MQVGCREHCPWAAHGVGKESSERSIWLEDGAEIQQLFWSWKPGYSHRQSRASQQYAQLLICQMVKKKYTIIGHASTDACIIADGWQLDGTTAEFVEPTARKAAELGGLVPVYSQR